jgi:hypothetical protein
MTSALFDDIVKQRLEKIQSLLLKKRAEYAPEGGDRLHNFRRAAAMLNCSPEHALVGMWVKHVISILDIVDDIGRKVPSLEMIDEKLGDAVNYLILLEAMLKERYMEETKGRTDPAYGVLDYWQGELPATCTEKHCVARAKGLCISDVVGFAGTRRCLELIFDAIMKKN